MTFSLNSLITPSKPTPASVSRSLADLGDALIDQATKASSYAQALTDAAEEATVEATTASEQSIAVAQALTILKDAGVTFEIVR